MSDDLPENQTGKSQNQEKGELNMKSILKTAVMAAAVALSGAVCCKRRAGQDRHGAGTLSAIRIDGCLRQMGRLGNRAAGCGLHRGQARLRHHADRLGRHHPGADHQEDRRDLELDVDHRRAQEDDRLLRQILQHADRHRRRQGPEVRRSPRRPQGQGDWRAGLDGPFRLRQEAFHRGRGDQGVPDAGRGQPGSRRRAHRRHAGRIRSLWMLS